MAAEFSGYAITLNNIPESLQEADIIISATASPVPILGKGVIESAIRKRKHRPMFIVDIAVPRDVESQAGELEDVYLYTVDDLKEVIDENMRNRREAAQQAEEIIDTHVSRFMEWVSSLDAVSTICAIRDQANLLQQQLLDSGRQKLQQGADPERVLQEVTRILTNKLIHSPSTQLRNASALGRHDLLQAARELYNIPAGKDPSKDPQ